MKQYKVYFMPDAQSDLKDIYSYIARKSKLPEVAMAYLKKLQQKCEDLSHFPERGAKRDDIRKNLRIMALEKNAMAAFEISKEKQAVVILNIFYGGRDYEAIMTKNSISD